MGCQFNIIHAIEIGMMHGGPALIGAHQDRLPPTHAKPRQRPKPPILLDRLLVLAEAKKPGGFEATGQVGRICPTRGKQYVHPKRIATYQDLLRLLRVGLPCKVFSRLLFSSLSRARRRANALET